MDTLLKQKKSLELRLASLAGPNDTRTRAMNSSLNSAPMSSSISYPALNLPLSSGSAGGSGSYRPATPATAAAGQPMLPTAHAQQQQQQQQQQAGSSGQIQQQQVTPSMSEE
eukprot:1179709-Prorocentrum_minimum.AAC.1